MITLIPIMTMDIPIIVTIVSLENTMSLADIAVVRTKRDILG